MTTSLTRQEYDAVLHAILDHICGDLEVHRFLVTPFLREHWYLMMDRKLIELGKKVVMRKN